MMVMMYNTMGIRPMMLVLGFAGAQHFLLVSLLLHHPAASGGIPEEFGMDGHLMGSLE